jgi:hypothetical protein
MLHRSLSRFAPELRLTRAACAALAAGVRAVAPNAAAQSAAGT